MRTALLMAVFAVSPVLADQTVWKWVDDKGVTHYSDQHRPGAEKVDIAVSSRSDAPAPSTPSTATRSPAANQPVYQRLEITRPASDESVVNTGGEVSVSISIQPTLRGGHKVELLIDGQKQPGSGLQFNLKGVPRGTHTASAVVVDASGSRIQESAGVTFHVLQNSIANPPVGPTLRPPPKPRN